MRSVPGTKTASIWVSGLLVVCAGVTGAFLGANRKAPAPTGASESMKGKIAAAMSRLPLTFQENRGQAGKGVKFVTRGAGYSFWLSPTSTTLALAKLAGTPAGGKAPASVIRMRMVGANAKAKVSGAGTPQGHTNYLIGPDSKKWIRDIPNFSKVRYTGIYNGVDLEYYGSQQELEHDFIVKPGANPSSIRLAYDGVQRAEITKDGELHLHTLNGTIEQKKPKAYQTVHGQRQEIASHYTQLASNQIGFEVDGYDTTKPLVIDPVLRYSTYVGGSMDDYGFDIAIDPDRNVYVTGYTGSYTQDQDTRPGALPAAEGGPRPNIEALGPFPTVNPYQADRQQNDSVSFQPDLSTPGNGSIDARWDYSLYDAFVFKLNNTGSGLVFSTYLGAESDDYGLGIAVDGNRNPYITGRTNSVFWPLNVPVQGNGGGADGFVVKLSTAGNALVYSTYIGGSGTDFGRSIAVDATGNAHVAGLTNSTDFPTFRAAQATFGGGARDAFVTSLDASGSAYNYSTYLGGAGDEGGSTAGVDLTYIPNNIALPYNVNLPAPYAGFQFPADTGFPNAVPLGIDYTVDLAVDPQGNAVITGGTTSTEGSGFPVTGGVVGPAHAVDGGRNDAFVTKYLPDGVISYSTFLGGTSDDAGRSVALNNAGEAFVTGYTLSTNFPTHAPFQSVNHGGVDAFVVKLDDAGTSFVYSTYLGGTGMDIGNGIAVSAGGQAYVAGSTTSSSTGANAFPTANFFQSNLIGGTDVFVTKFRPDGSSLEFSTYLGGTSTDRAMSIALDDRAQSYIAGITSSGNLPTAQGSMDRSINTGTVGGTERYGAYPNADAFVSKFHAPPFAASNLIATDVQLRSVSIAWTDQSDNEDGFEIERKLGGGPTGTWAVIQAVGQDQVTFTNTGLIPTTTYSYRVRPFNSDGVSTYYGPYTNQLVVTTLPQAPSSPSNFVATALDTQRIRLSWTDVADNEESYILERRDVPVGTFAIINGGNPLPGSSPATLTGGTLTFTDTGLTANTTYEYRLRARNVAGDSPQPFPTVQATTLAPAPTVKPVVTVTTVSNSALQVDWTYAVTPPDHIGFKIYRKGPGDPSFSLLRTTPDRSTTFADTGLAAGSTYCYRVLAYNASGDGPQSDPLTGVCGDTLPNPPAPPTNLRATLTAPNTAVLVWADNSTAPEETGFKIEASTNNFTSVLSTTTVPSHMGTGDVTPVSIPGLLANTVYYYRVVAFSTNAGGDSTSTPTNVACLLTQPAAPTNLAVANLAAGSNGDTRLLVSWTDNNPVTNTPSTFRVQRSTNSGGPFATIAGTPAGVQGGAWSVTDTGLTPNTTYYYQVNAFNTPPAGCDPNSGGASAVIGPVSGTTRPAAPTLNSVVEIPPTTGLRLTWTDNSPVKTQIRIERATNAAFTNNLATVHTATAGETTWDDTSTAGNLTYFYRLFAFNGVGDSAVSNVGSRLTLPGKPTNVTANASPDASTAARIQVDISWTDGSAAPSAFKVELSTTGMAGPYSAVPGSPTAVGATTLRVGNLNPAIEYCFRVRGTNATGDGENSTVACPPAGPTGLTATVVSDTEIRLDWEDRSSTETDFHIERVKGISFATGTNHTDLFVGGPNIHTYLDGGLTPNTTYTYRVTAIGNGGTSAPSREAGATTLKTAPASATNLVATPVSASQVNLTWDHNGLNLSGFVVERSTNSAFPAGSTSSFNVGTSLPYGFQDTGLGGNATYYYRVTAVNGTSKAAPSSTASALTFPSKPTNLAATAIGAARIDLTWTDNSAVPSDFKIERKQEPGGSFAEIGITTAPGTTYSDVTGLLPATTYTYRVRGTNATGDGAYSDEASATTLPSKPNPPSGLQVATVSQTALRLTWTDASNNETGFKIERSPNGSTGWRQIGTAGQDATSYLDQGLLAETTYFYRVSSTNAGGDSNPSNVASGTTLPNLPSAPSGLTVTVPAAPDGSTKLVLTWSDASSNESGFKIERSKDNFAAPANTTLVTTTAANATTYTDSRLTPDTIYYYRVRATNLGGDSANTSSASARTLVAAPTAPSGLTVTPLSSSSLRVDWTDTSNNEDGFKLERSLDGSNFTLIAAPGAGVTTYTDTGLAASTRYYYRVRSTNAGGDSAPSNTGNALTFAAPPAAPSNLIATAMSSSSIGLTWDDNSATETGFKIERKLLGGAYAPVQTVAANVRTFTDNGLAADTTYVYHVIATNLGGDSAASNEANAKTLPTTPTAPSGLTATPLSQTQIRLNWTDASNNETGFKIERSLDGTTWNPAGTVAQNTTSYTDGGLTANTLYSYRVKATNAGGDSAPSNTAQARTNPVAPGNPTNLTATALSQTSVSLNWTIGTGTETGFKLERKLEGGTYAQIGTAPAGATSATDNGVSAGATYVYRIRATNAGGDSPYSNEATVTALPNLPGAPTQLTVTALSQTSLKLDWNDNSSDETGFEIERTVNGVGAAAVSTNFSVDPNVTTFTDTGLSPNSSYSYRVRAINIAGPSAWSSSVTGTTLPNTPTAPSNLTVTVRSLSALALKWTDNSSTETGFKIERRLGASKTAPFDKVAEVGSNVTEWVDTSVTEGETYTYRVRAINSGGESAASNEVGVLLSASGRLQVSVKSVAFGNSPTGRTKVKTFKIKNTGRTSLQGYVASLDAPFRVSVGSGSFTLAPGKALTVKVEFSPVATGSQSQTLQITSTDPARQTVNLSVTGIGTTSRR